MTVVQSVRGMRDVLPEEARRWQRVEDAMLQKLHGYAYEEIHIPLLESTDLFQRSVGEATDIVENEMYNLNARDGESMTLRPEEVLRLVGQGPFRILLGYAPGVQMQYNGETVSLLAHTRNNVASLVLGQ